MMINDDDKKGFKKMMSGRAVYIALGVCVLAAGIVGYTALDKTPEVQVEITSPPAVTYQNKNAPVYRSEKVTVDMNSEEPTSPGTAQVSEAEPETDEPEVKAVFDNDEEGLTEAVNSPPEQYQLPLSSAMGKDYSMGVPVFNETMGDYRTHNGVDFTGNPGDAVKPIAPGRVTSVENDLLKGNVVTVDHGGGVTSSIWGLSDEGLVGEGTDVVAESVIGVLGNIPCEKEDGAHIHLEVRMNGELCDPLEVMGFAENTSE